MKKANNRSHAYHPHPSTNKNRSTQAVETTPSLFFRHLGKSVLITFAAGALLLLLASLVAYFYKDPDALIAPLALMASALTALIGGFAAVRIHGHAALFCGLCNGCASMALMILASLFLKAYASGYSPGIALLFHLLFLLLSVAGAYLGLQRARPKSKKRH